MRDADAENPETEEVVLSGEINSGPMLSDEISFFNVEPPKTIEEANFMVRGAINRMKPSWFISIFGCSFIVNWHNDFPSEKVPSFIIILTGLAVADILRRIQVHRVATKYIGEQPPSTSATVTK